MKKLVDKLWLADDLEEINRLSTRLYAVVRGTSQEALAHWQSREAIGRFVMSRAKTKDAQFETRLDDLLGQDKQTRNNYITNLLEQLEQDEPDICPLLVLHNVDNNDIFAGALRDEVYAVANELQDVILTHSIAHKYEGKANITLDPDLETVTGNTPNIDRVLRLLNETRFLDNWLLEYAVLLTGAEDALTKLEQLGLESNRPQELLRQDYGTIGALAYAAVNTILDEYEAGRAEDLVAEDTETGFMALYSVALHYLRRANATKYETELTDRLATHEFPIQIPEERQEQSRIDLYDKRLQRTFDALPVEKRLELLYEQAQAAAEQAGDRRYHQTKMAFVDFAEKYQLERCMGESDVIDAVTELDVLRVHSLMHRVKEAQSEDDCTDYFIGDIQAGTEKALDEFGSVHTERKLYDQAKITAQFGGKNRYLELAMTYAVLVRNYGKELEMTERDLAEKLQELAALRQSAMN